MRIIRKFLLFATVFCSLLQAQAANVTTSNNSSSSLGSGNSGRGSPSVTTSNHSSSNLGVPSGRGSPSLTTPNLSSSVLGNNTGRGSPTVTTSNNTSNRSGGGFGGGPTNAPLLPYNYTNGALPTGSSSGLLRALPQYHNSDAIPDSEQNPAYWHKSDVSRPYYIEQINQSNSWEQPAAAQ